MKIGVLITGVAFGIRERDWRDSIKSLYSNLIDPYRKDNDVYIYISSYRYPFERELVEELNPKAYTFVDFSRSNIFVTYGKGVGLIVEEPLDFVISTRFDIRFKSVIRDMLVDYNKFNVLFREANFWDNGVEFTTDNLYMFPHKYVKAFMRGIDYARYNHPLGCPDLHPAYKCIKTELGDENMNFIVDGFYSSHSNPFFDLIRR